MSFPTYPKYKDSGVPQIPEVPSHWQSSQLGFLCNRIGSGKTPKGGAEVYVDTGVPLIRSQNVYDDGLRLDDVAYIDRETDEEMRATRVSPGDILLNITGASLGRTCLVPTGFQNANVNQHVCVIRLSNPEQRNFLALALKSAFVKAQIDEWQNGAAREGLNFQQISKLCVFLPPLPEQRAIASFLDRETSKIDALVAEQQRLIELLKEKRQAVISHAVTKGLNPNAPLKPSGIEWLGDVPEHWEVSRVGLVCDYISYGFTNPMPAMDEGPYMLTANDINYGYVQYHTARRTCSEAFAHLTEKCRPVKDDLLLTKDGTLGRLAIHDGCEACINQSVALLRANKKRTTSLFMWLALQSGLYQRRMIYEAGGTTIKHIYISRLAKMPLAIPGLVEQSLIVDTLSDRTSEFDTLLSHTNTAIALLQERRTALISAAVTGKIDVCGVVDASEHRPLTMETVR